MTKRRLRRIGCPHREEEMSIFLVEVARGDVLDEDIVLEFATDKKWAWKATMDEIPSVVRGVVNSVVESMRRSRSAISPSSRDPLSTVTSFRKQFEPKNGFDWPMPVLSALAVDVTEVSLTDGRLISAFYCCLLYYIHPPGGRVKLLRSSVRHTEAGVGRC